MNPCPIGPQKAELKQETARELREGDRDYQIWSKLEMTKLR